MTPQQLAMKLQGQSLYQPVGDVIDATGLFGHVVNKGLNTVKPIIQGPTIPGQPNFGGGEVVPFTGGFATTKGLPDELRNALAIPRDMKPGDPHPILDQVSTGADPYANTIDPRNLTRQEYEAAVKAKYGTPSASDSAQTDFNPADPRMPLKDVQAAQEKMLMSAKQGNEAFRNKWSAWAFKNGMDPNEVVKAVTRLNANTDMDLSDNQIKYMLALAMQKAPK